VTTTGTHALIKAALTAAGIHAVDGPAAHLPVGSGGAVAQAAVLWPQPGLYQYTRASGTSSGRADRVLITCVGATTRDALAVADKVEAAIGGLMLSSKGGTLRQTLATSPAPEPNADPVRVSLAVEYSTITKG
jgi:hypothetical protein